MLSCFRNPISNKKEEGFFLRNGAAMLEHVIHDFNGKCNPIRMYSVEELSKATNGYKSDDLIKEDWNFKLYKGVHEGQEILVKTFQAIRNVDYSVDLITNEVAIASNMSNHKNFLKLIGCCLETKLPTLVYEFPAKGNLCSHIFRESDHHVGLVWPTNLNIAIQVADAVAYLHYGTTKVIVHRDIKPGNIFLDQDYVAKLSEFRESVPIPSGETHVFVPVCGTLGYLDPECLSQGRTSEKSDVYSFGSLLFVLFAGKRIGSLRSSNESAGISNPGSPCSYNESARLLANRCKSYLEANILEDENKKQVEEYAKLVERCLQENPDERPVMTEVAQLLRSIKSL